MIFEEGGAGRLAPGEGTPCLARGVCTVGTLNRLRYIQRNMITANVTTSTRLVTPTPRNTSTVQVSRGRQIAVLEAETHKECRGCRIRSCCYSQSATPILRVPMVAAITCNVKISSIKIPR